MDQALARFVWRRARIAGIDPSSGRIVRLFNPRRDRWRRHFRWNGPILVGRTAVGRATIEVLEISDSNRVLHRQALIDEGIFPPE